jgi:phage FluMu gp28-like protein
MNELINKFADQMDVDADVVSERWEGQPDKIAEDLFKVEDLDTGEIQDLELFSPYQPKIMHAYFYGEASTLNVYKGRRIGVSYIICVAMLLDGMMNKRAFFPIVSQKEEQAQSRISDISSLIELCKIDIPVKKDIAGEITLWNDATFKAYTGNPGGARGDDSAKTVFIDEMAFLEDQEDTSRAFSPFVSLGSRGMMVEVSTPESKNDLFMSNHARGTETGFDENGDRIGTISIKQPTFANADEIDLETPLTDQDVEPVRPDLNIEKVEEDRLKDPQGFAQEYLCRPIDESYRFFSETSVEDAMGRSTSPEYEYGLFSPKSAGAQRVMGVDIGIDKDDTVISVTDRLGDRRNQRFIEVVDNDVLQEVGIEDPDRGNAVHVAHRVAQIHSQMECDRVVMDKTGPGETFERIIERKLGRNIIGFNFSDKEKVETMMGDMNACLRNEQAVLIDDDDLFDQITSIVKKQKEDWQRPKFTGKEYSESGKDDMAIASILSFFPPNLTTEPATNPASKEAPEPPEEYTKKTNSGGGSGGSDIAGGTVESKTGQTTGAFSKKSVSRRGGGRQKSRSSKYPRKRRRR